MAGLLYVTMQPNGSLPPSQFANWYHNEHGPLRLRLPFVANGFRFRAVDGAEPAWLALYDIDDMQELTRAPYLALRGDGIRTQREKDTMAQVAVGRKLYDVLLDRQAEHYRPLDQLRDGDCAGAMLLAVTMTVRPGEPEDDFNRWYADEHIPLLARIPGWRRSRRFVTSAIDAGAPKEYVALHEFAAVNGLDGPEHQAAVSTPWRSRVLDRAVVDVQRRRFVWSYTFGPAPRELGALTAASEQPWSSNDGRTTTTATPRPAVESFVTTPDGVDLPYRLEGSTDPHAPLVVLSNSILVDWSVWDGFVDAFLADPQNQPVRVLRYLTRGRLANAGDLPVTIDVLAGDIIALLDALRVPQASLVGVSLGGVSVLNAALLYPARVRRFIACDTNSSSPEANRKAWNDRIALAEADHASAATGERIVGPTLAQATVSRWFVDQSIRDQPALFAHVKAVVERNSLDGFRRAAQALCAYDVRERMANASVPGLFVAGAGDGVLPQTMQKMAADLSLPAELKLVADAGHLPMVEQPARFTELVTAFLHA